MAREMKLYKVGIALVDNRGGDNTNWRSINVLATDASTAIRKASKNFIRGEYVEEVEIIGTVDA